MKTITKSITIHASKEKVWDVLTKDEYTKEWYSEFAQGSKAETDWKVGSKAKFTDGTESGMLSIVSENRPGEYLSMEYSGIVVNGKEDMLSAEAKKYIGGKETYRLSEKDGHDGSRVTQLEISSDMADDQYEYMAELWEKALRRVKDLSEKESGERMRS